jgi:hypothetical protein
MNAKTNLLETIYVENGSARVESEDRFWTEEELLKESSDFEVDAGEHVTMRVYKLVGYATLTAEKRTLVPVKSKDKKAK